MKFKDFIDMYDNWNGITVVNDDDLNMIVSGPTHSIAKEKNFLWDMKVVSFGFYDNELCVRVSCQDIQRMEKQ